MVPTSLTAILILFVFAFVIKKITGMPVFACAMMAGKSDWLENKLIDFLFRGQTLPLTGAPASWSAAPALFIALGTAASDASFTELPATGSYARVKICAGAAMALTDMAGTHAAASTTASSGTSGQTSNNNAVTFPTATADWNSAAIIGYFAIYDALTNGNLLYWAALTTARAVTNGTTASFAAAALTVTED